jgi:prepilin-type N-terminal cleavage/methylation domain-containing protein
MKRSAFTLVELLVVIAVIWLLSTVAVVSLDRSRMNARNATRKANLLQVSKALELYYSDNGSYPSTGGSWRGACSNYQAFPDAYVDATHDAWIPGLTPQYMARLPRDPNTNKGNPGNAAAGCRTDPGNSCYLYRSDDGTGYKLLAYCTPEGTLSAADPFVTIRCGGITPGKFLRLAE